MNEISILLTVVAVHFVGLISPGPDVALVIQNASRYGRQTGVLIAMGLTCGICLHLTFSFTGIGLLIKSQPFLFSLLQLAGGSYLLYLGIGAIKATLANWNKEADILGSDVILLSRKRDAFRRGFITNILNPKAFVFFISLLSSVIPIDMSTSGKLTAAALLLLVSFLWFASLAWLLTVKPMQKRLASIVKYIDSLCGVVFMLAGGTILWQSLQVLLV